MTARRYRSPKPYRLDPSKDASVLSGLAAVTDDYFVEDAEEAGRLVAGVLAELLDRLPEIQRVGVEQIVLQGATLRHAASHYSAGQVMESPLDRVRIAAFLGVKVEQVDFSFLVELGNESQRRINKPASPASSAALADYRLELAEAADLRALLRLVSHRRIDRAAKSGLASLREQLLAMGWLLPYLGCAADAAKLAPAGKQTGGLLALLAVAA